MANFDEIKTGSTVKAVAVLQGTGTSGQVLRPNQLNPDEITYGPATSPPADQYEDDEQTITGGANTADLTDLTDLEGTAMDGTGRKLQEIRVQCPSSNTAVVVVSAGDSNGLDLFGSGNSVEVVQGGLLVMRFNDKLDDIGASDKDIKFAGTNGDTYQTEYVLG